MRLGQFNRKRLFFNIIWVCLSLYLVYLFIKEERDKADLIVNYMNPDLITYRKAPDLVIADFQGNRYKLSRFYATNKKIMVHIFSVHCDICIKELPQLLLLSQVDEKIGLRLVLINVETPRELMEVYYNLGAYKNTLFFATPEEVKKNLVLKSILKPG